MRLEKDLTIDEIAERLAISRQTIFYWVKDLPIERVHRPSPAHERRDKANSERFRARRVAAYEQGFEEYNELVREPTFRDFVCIYIGEGSKRNRNIVSVCNSNMDVMYLAEHWIARFARNPLRYSLQYHADQDPDQLRKRWADLLDIEPDSISLQRKSNSNQMTGRTWRSRHGILAIRVGDTYFRARLQAWMDRLTSEWLDLPLSGA
jgi:hypothetical protein